MSNRCVSKNRRSAGADDVVEKSCGIGKSWLAGALAPKTCRDGYTVRYARVRVVSLAARRLLSKGEQAIGDWKPNPTGRSTNLHSLITIDGGHRSSSIETGGRHHSVRPGN
jgi:hypothetical protein